MSDWFPPISFEKGADCLACFGVNETPIEYYVMFQGIERGDNWLPAFGPPLNGLYVLPQTAPDPCWWSASVSPGWFCRYSSTVIASNLVLDGDPYVPVFRSFNAPACIRYHTNDYNVPAGNFFYGGFAFVFMPAEIQALIELHTPVVDPDPLLKVEPLAGSLIVVSYIDRWGDTKFKMKVDVS